MATNLGTGAVVGDLKCDGCGYVGDVHGYRPSASIYSDVVCPHCGSTNNEHNTEYARRLQEAWEEFKRH